MLQDFTKLPILNFIVLPFILVFIYIIAYRFRNNHYNKQHPWRKYFIPALTVKITGAIFISLVYAVYYKSGDTFLYFYHSQVINSAFDESFNKWFNLLLHIPSPSNGEYYEYISKMKFYNSPDAYTISSITAFLCVFTLNTYLPAAVLLGALSFTGVWALFRTFATQYPHLLRPLSVSLLFIPSVIVWGSGVYKDTLCIFALGWLTYATSRLLIHRKFSLRNILWIVFSITLIAIVKIYILLCFIPALILWVFFSSSNKIKTKSLRLVARIFMIFLFSATIALLIQQLGNRLGQYSLDKIVKTSEMTGLYLRYTSDLVEGSTYTLGKFDYNIENILTKFPAAVNVTLFRPYPWEARKVIVMLSALEAMIFLFITLKVIFSIGPIKIVSTIVKDPTIQFCLIFSVLFAFAVGISTNNFGTLSRYKIPCLPFFLMALILIYYENRPKNKKLLPFM